MRLPLILCAVAALAACGADGEPLQPTAHTNVTLNSGGVSVGTNVRVGRGPFSLNLGLGL